VCLYAAFSNTVVAETEHKNAADFVMQFNAITVCQSVNMFIIQSAESFTVYITGVRMNHLIHLEKQSLSNEYVNSSVQGSMKALIAAVS